MANAVYLGRGEPFSDEDMRIWRERDEAWARMEEEFPRVKAEHPDMWVAFCKDGFITANDDLFALVDDYKAMGYTSRQVLIEFTHVSVIPLWGVAG